MSSGWKLLNNNWHYFKNNLSICNKYKIYNISDRIYIEKPIGKINCKICSNFLQQNELIKNKKISKLENSLNVIKIIDKDKSIQEDRKTTPSKEQILSWWEENGDECDFGVDFSEALSRCWRCGRNRSLECCHISPKSLTENNHPSNYILLCRDCHLENPNLDNRELYLLWIKQTCASQYEDYDLYELNKGYLIMFGLTIIEELLLLRKYTPANIDIISTIKNIEKTVVIKHFGEESINIATIVLCYYNSFKQLLSNIPIYLVDVYNLERNKFIKSQHNNFPINPKGFAFKQIYNTVGEKPIHREILPFSIIFRE